MFFTVKLNYIDHPLVRVEQKRYARLLTTTRLGRWLNLLGYTGLLLIAAVPLLLYIDADKSAVLLFMALIMTGFYIALILRTLAVVTHVDHAQQFDTLLLTGISARQIVMGRWWALMRVLLPLWLIAVIPKLGVAYGLAQYLQIIPVNGACWAQLPNSFCYLGVVPGNSNPALLPVMLGGLFLAIIHVFVLAFLCAAGLWSSLRLSESFATRITTFMLSVFLIGSGVWGTLLLEHAAYATYSESICAHDTICETMLWGPQCQVTSYQPECIEEQRAYQVYEKHMNNLLRGIHFLQVSSLSLADGGVSLAARVMEPDAHIPYLGMLLTRILSLFITIVTLQSVTWLMLRLAVRAAIRRGMSP